jgi:MFS family permease
VQLQNKKPNIFIWFTATFLLFFGRAFIYSTWVTRGPEVKKLLALNTFQMGVMSMLYPIGGLLAVQYSSLLVHRFGSKKVAFGIYTIASTTLIGAGFSIINHHVWLTALFLLITGSQMAIGDFLGNYEGTIVDAASKRSIFSAIHSAYGLGMMAAATLGGVLSDNRTSISNNYLIVGSTSFAIAIFALLTLPKRVEVAETEAERKILKAQVKSVWRERRSQLIAIVGVSFIMAEMSAAIWVPLALTSNGFTAGRAAFAMSFFWIIMTVMRAIGGSIVDAIGRYRTVKYSTLLTAIGIGLFALNGVIAVPYLALLIWGIGMALGFPMSVSAMGDDKHFSAARINMIMTTVYITSITVGPSLGSIGQLFNIYVAFAIPAAVSLIAFKLSAVTKPLNS